MPDRKWRIVSVVGTRPHLTKLASIAEAFSTIDNATHLIVHTGQHYDPELNADLCRELAIPPFELTLEAGGRPIEAQWAYLMTHLPDALRALAPDLVLVYGDTTSTAAACLAASLCKFPVGHVEAGLREFDLAIPEEVNKRLTDALSSLYLCPGGTAAAQLQREGIVDGIVITGDTALDLASRELPLASRTWFAALGLDRGKFALCTIHRECNTVVEGRLRQLCTALNAHDTAVVMPLHPRTRAAIQRSGLVLAPHVRVLEPVPYFHVQALLREASLVLTDSGGLTKEGYQLGKPVILLDDQTEWVEAVAEGYVKIAGADAERIRRAAIEPFELRPQSYPYGRGGAGAAVVAACLAFLREFSQTNPRPRAPYRRR